MTATAKTGLGHQMKADEKALNAMRKTLQTAWMEAYGISGDDGERLRNDIYKLINTVDDLAHSANEAYRIND